jgi:hypothetical protein
MMGLEDMSPAERRESGNVALDGLAVIAALHRGDTQSANAMLEMYAAEGHDCVWGLVQSCFALTTRLLSTFTPDPELVLQSLAHAIRENS